MLSLSPASVDSPLLAFYCCNPAARNCCHPFIYPFLAKSTAIIHHFTLPGCLSKLPKFPGPFILFSTCKQVHCLPLMRLRFLSPRLHPAATQRITSRRSRPAINSHVSAVSGSASQAAASRLPSLASLAA